MRAPRRRVPGRARHRKTGRGAAGGGTAGSRAGSRGTPALHRTASDGPGLSEAHAERHLSWPALPTAVVSAAAFVLGAGVLGAFTGGHALFPSGRVGWSLAVLTGIVVGHLVMLGRSRWWGGTGSGAAVTLAVLLLYGWVPAGMVSLTVVVLVGVARRGRWRQGILHGAVDLLGIGAGALVLALCGSVPSVESPSTPDRWGLHTAFEVVLVAAAYLAVTRALYWYLHVPRGDCPRSPAPPWSDRAWSRWRSSA
ncbi:bifunctional diguanylate cyclase/phosphodiesterase [Streptomyces hirsutus]